MAVSFVDIYERSIASIDDPTITSSFVKSPIEFFKIMYTYLVNAIPSFNNPDCVQLKLSFRVDPDYEIQTFVGDGITSTFPLSSTPLPNSYYEYTINGVSVVGTYNSIANTVTFPYPIPLGQSGTFEWYFAGEFSKPMSDIEKSILSKLLVVRWGEKEKNFLLDIRRLLYDTDFKLNSEANTNRSKVGWYDDMREEAEKLMEQYAWSLYWKKR